MFFDELDRCQIELFIMTISASCPLEAVYGIFRVFYQFQVKKRIVFLLGEFLVYLTVRFLARGKNKHNLH